ncbi:hypothetical protein N431DRAFT_430658 [Stipitochalara longipes BDJ]|nr:hypothetical protein N431DRAFT_430658 [Stipitochalara longipes BDJ]
MSTSRTPAITIVEPSIREGDDLSRVPTNGSLSQIDEDREHKQDWTIVTDEKDSWANRERRRSSVWAKLELVPATTVNAATAVSSSPKKGSFGSQGAPRRGSILSMWAGGKDKNGKDILMHDDHSESEEENEEAVGSPRSEEVVVERERRGSVLSMWKKGKDEHGNNVIIHDDEEWKV